MLDAGAVRPDPWVAGPVPEPADAGLEIVVETDAGYDVLRLRGEFDVSTTAPVRRAVDDLVIDQSRVHLVVDLTDVRFLDSCGLGALVRAQRQCRGLRGSLALVCPDGPVRRTIELTGLHRVLRVFETRGAATAEPVGRERP